MRHFILVLGLMLTGCVSTSQHEQDVAKLRDELRAELKVEKDKLAKTQFAVCGQGMQQCMLVLSLQAAIAGEEVDPDQIQGLCAVQATQCLETLSSTPKKK